jgi:hypothetical protein
VRAREWAIATAFGTPADYGIPELPGWRVSRPDRGGIALATDGEPFITAEHPATARR